MARLIESAVKKPLAELLLFGDLAPGAIVTVDEEGGAIRLRVGA
jgi:ATP-dependent Clp protease ATP-binding subunit ClpA